jgi:hypothetical protein
MVAVVAGAGPILAVRHGSSATFAGVHERNDPHRGVEYWAAKSSLTHHEMGAGDLIVSSRLGVAKLVDASDRRWK